jgi:hypothetical protein
VVVLSVAYLRELGKRVGDATWVYSLIGLRVAPRVGTSELRT